MAKRYSALAGKMIDVPERPVSAVPDLRAEVAALQAQIDTLTAQRAEMEARAVRAEAALAARPEPVAMPAPVVNVPAPVVNIPAPVVNMQTQDPVAYKVRVTQRDGHGRFSEAVFEPQKSILDSPSFSS